MANFNNFNDIRRYIDDSIANMQLPDHYKDQVEVYTKFLIPTNQEYLGTPTKILKSFEIGDKWLVGDELKVYTFDGTKWVASYSFTPENGDYYFVIYYLENDNTKLIVQTQANVTFNGNSETWDIAKDLYYQPDGTYLLTDAITGQMTVSNKLKSYHDALSVLGATNTLNLIVQKTNGQVGVEKRTLTGEGLIKVVNGVMSLDPVKYLSSIVVTGGASEPNTYVSGITVSGNTLNVMKTVLPTPPTLNDLGGQRYNDLLEALSSLPQGTGFLNISYDAVAELPKDKWKLALNNNLVTNTSLTTILNEYQKKANILTKLSEMTGNMVNGTDYIINLHQNSSTIGDYTATAEPKSSFINFGTDTGTPGGGKFLSNLIKDANGNLIRTYASALTTIGLTGNVVESGKAIVSASYSGGTITFTKQSFLQSIVKGTTTGTGNVVTDATISGNTITLNKGINALTAITKAMVEAVLTGTISTHNHNGTYDPAGSSATALNNSKSYTNTKVEDELNGLLTAGTTKNNSLLKIIKDIVNAMITDAKFPDFEDPIE